MIATAGGIVKSRTIKRIPKEEKWSEDNLRRVKWAPWKRHEGMRKLIGKCQKELKICLLYTSDAADDM
eukprot:7233489-Karenia_brevis.AAC.1